VRWGAYAYVFFLPLKKYMPLAAGAILQGLCFFMGVKKRQSVRFNVTLVYCWPEPFDRFSVQRALFQNIYDF